MDRKSIIILGISVVLFVMWTPLVNKLFPPVPASTNQVLNATGGTNRSPASNNTPGNSNSPSVPAATLSAATTPGLGKITATEQTLVTETSLARYTFTSHGGGLKVAELKEFPASVACNQKKDGATNQLVTLNTKALVPAFAILGNETVTGDGEFKLTKNGGTVRAEKTLPSGLTLVKEFTPGSNYVLNVAVKYENRSAQPVRVPPREIVLGTATPVNQRDDSSMMGLDWHNGSKIERVASSWFQNRTMGCSVASQPRLVYEATSPTNIPWAAVHNQFFTMVAIPREAVGQIVSHRVELPPPTMAEQAEDPKTVAHPVGFQTGFIYPELTVPPNQSIEQHFEVYAGPKEYRTLARLASETSTSIDAIMGFDGFFGWFAKALLLSMNGLHTLGLGYGLGIVAITVIIKLLFWPLTQASTRSMKRMSALQPQMKAIQEKYKADPQKMNTKLMEFMKENKVSPLGGCLPMLIQIPVFFGFFTMLRSAIELRGASFLWACDLSQPDTLFIIPGLNIPFNLLPLIMTGTTLWQTHLTPPSPGVDPAQQKIMRFMPLMFIVILYNYQSGLTLYWTTQNLLSVAQMKLTRDKNPKDQKPAGGNGHAHSLPKKQK